MDFLRATLSLPPPPGHIHLPLRWWLRPHKIVRPDLYYHQIHSVRMTMYTCRNGPLWVGNNWHVYRIHLNHDSDVLSLPHLTDRIWYHGTEPVLLEPVTRLQLLMESIWDVS